MKYEYRLTAKTIESIKEPGKYFDGHGLYVEVTATGSKLWRLKYRINGKERRASLGAWPRVTLKEARQRAAETMERAKQGIDPIQEKKSLREAARAENERIALTFEKVAFEWHDKQTRNNVESHRKNTLQRLKSHVLPYIGGVPIDELSPAAILAAVRHTEDRGSYDLTHRLLQLIGQICRYARAAGYVPFNVAADLSDALMPVPRHTPRAALTDPREVMFILQSIDAYAGYAPITYALKIMPYVFVRSQELRGARWQEIDFDRALWTIPAERMKTKTPHIVPLARQVTGLFQELRTWTGNSDFVFTSTHSKNKAITDNGLLLALRRMGYGKEEMSIHGFRSIASTLLNESGAYRPDVIEAQLAHAERNKVRAAYNRAGYLEERTIMMQQWADYLDALRAGNVQTMKEWLKAR